MSATSVYTVAVCHRPRSLLARCMAGQSMNWSSGTKLIGSLHVGHRVADLITDQPCPALARVSIRGEAKSGQCAHMHPESVHPRRRRRLRWDTLGGPGRGDRDRLSPKRGDGRDAHGGSLAPSCHFQTRSGATGIHLVGQAASASTALDGIEALVFGAASW